jgi:hypothetical protein
LPIHYFFLQNATEELFANSDLSSLSTSQERERIEEIFWLLAKGPLTEPSQRLYSAFENTALKIA